MQPLIFEKDPTFWYETLRSFGHIAYGGADFGEVVMTAQRIAEGDYDSWHDEWLATADRVAAEARAALAGGHAVSARDGFLRASNYYRSAEFFLHGAPDDPRVDAAYTRQVACFRAYAELVEHIEPVLIPYGPATLSGYFYRGTRGATVVMHNGFDGSAEEMHFFAAAALHERGYNVLTFDGPGQPAAMRAGLLLRPDWEHVVAPVLDWLLSSSSGAPYDVDPERVALLGASMGGLLAPRAAAFEPRVKALIAFDGVYDMGAVIAAHVGGDRAAARAALEQPEADEFIRGLMAQHPVARWAFTHGTWVTGSTRAGYALKMLDYHLRDGVAERIACPTLVCAAPDDFSFQGQPEALYEHLTCEKTLIEFSAAEGADAHCQSGAQKLALARIADWLEGAFR
ncbi:alpha/beta fold hydrolase [Nonomuraea phyllanthi]|uniref:alpha/beta hydrolase family protein n=1 Tax=Nonomuraea phyllanthi TaxID=2219224 RepID=UPI001293594D|nr:alpha/beta fold hydrolase [Nonomuraea phyllanthi]QFY07037.1 alpha/beta fold hydrolase [Nonomuraea phyllanthi]